MKTGKVNFWEIDDSGADLRHGDAPVSWRAPSAFSSVVMRLDKAPFYVPRAVFATGRGKKESYFTKAEAEAGVNLPRFDHAQNESRPNAVSGFDFHAINLPLSKNEWVAA
jgi:hypothetical protein